MKPLLPLVCVMLSGPALAQENRQLDAHEHGVGALDIAVDGTTVAMEFHAPGADIVGFEHAAESAEDRAAVDAALAMLARPMDLFALPAAAECSVTQASAELERGDADEDEHEDYAEDAGHDDHAEAGDGAGHTEFHAEYMLTCARPDAITEIAFPYFEAFENAREVMVRIVTGSGAQAFDVERDAPTLDLRGVFRS